jgi:hypothetical protein
MKPGTILKNGATALHFLQRSDDKQLVLACWDDHHHRFVTWRLDKDGNTFLGHYFDNINDAMNDLMTR